jgi:HEAT repeat protein
MRMWILVGVAVVLVVVVALTFRSSQTPAALQPPTAIANLPANVPAPTAANIPELAEALKSPDANRAVAAAVSLGYSRNPAAVEPLANAVQDARPQVQATAMNSLAQLQAKIDPAPIIQLTESTADPAVRAAGLDYLAVKAEPKGVLLMLKGLEDPDVQVRGRAYAGIRALMGREYHYHPDDPLDKRQEAIARIRATVPTTGWKEK